MPLLLQVDFLISEMNFTSATLPWHGLYFWYARTQLSQLLAPGAKVMPQGATLRGLPIQFDDLWKIRSPVGLCEGFDLSTFDDLIEVHHTCLPPIPWSISCSSGSTCSQLVMK